MRQRSFVFLVVLFLLFSGEISGQQKRTELRYPVDVKALMAVEFGDNLNYKGPGNDSTNLQQLQKKEIISIQVRPAISFAGSVITPSYYCNSLGFFCKRELQLQKLISLPVYIRLGGLQYVNYLEQKPNAVRLGF